VTGRQGRLPPGIYRRGQGYRVIVYAGRDPTTKRKRQVSGTARTLAEAKALRARLLLEVGGGHHQAGSLTVADLMGRWLAQLARGDASPSSVAAAQTHTKRYILPRLGQVRLSKLGPDLLDGFYGDLQRAGGRCRRCWRLVDQGQPPMRPGDRYQPKAGATGKHRRPAERVHEPDCAAGLPLSAAYVRRIHVTVHAALHQAVKWRWLAANPAAQASPPSGRNPPIVPPEHEQVARLLVAAAMVVDSDFATWLHLEAVTGARPAEVCALRWRHLDLDRGELAISRGIVRGPGGLVDRDVTKNGEPRRISLAAATVELLRARRNRALQDALACGAHLTPDAYVFSADSAGRTPMRPDGIGKRFARLRKALDLPGLRLYDLRHHAATSLLRGGIDVLEVAGRLGHDPAVLLRVYGHYRPASDQRAAELLARLINPDAMAGER
jgi:integrase